MHGHQTQKQDTFFPRQKRPGVLGHLGWSCHGLRMSQCMQSVNLQPGSCLITLQRRWRNPVPTRWASPDLSQSHWDVLCWKTRGSRRFSSKLEKAYPQIPRGRPPLQPRCGLQTPNPGWAPGSHKWFPNQALCGLVFLWWELGRCRFRAEESHVHPNIYIYII